MLVSEFYAKLATPIRGTETIAQYNSMSKSQRDSLKDVGGFIGGELLNGIRKAGYITYRDFISLDFDAVPAGFTNEFVQRAYAMNINFCLYTTRNHKPEAPRFRLIVPTNRSMTADEYEPVARLLSTYICQDMSWLDRTTFDISRIMYWPSCCSDSQYICNCDLEKPFLSVDGMLSCYNDWRNILEWPLCPSENKNDLMPATKQKDPLEKIGVVGAFCRSYTISDVISKFLPDVYTPAGEGRYTYSKGSTTGGAVVYDNKYLYSHHATDPACDTLCNAFDLVRIHFFGSEDDSITAQTPPNRLPSYKAMITFARADPVVAEAINSDKLAEIEDDFGDAVSEEARSDYAKALKEWFQSLKREKDGDNIQKTAENISITLEKHPRLRGRFIKNTFAYKEQGVGPLPWGDRENLLNGTIFDWDDSDTSGLLLFIEKCTGIHTKNLILDALNECWARHSYHPIQNYVSSLKWDGVSRLDRIFIDYLGAEETEYVKAVTRMTFVAAITRIFRPGIKYDTVTVLVGPQGLGKSTLISIMAKNEEWFTDALKDLSDRSAIECIQGAWLVELGEMSALNKTELNVAKAFISRTIDKARMAYGRFAKTMPRTCIFFGTSNTKAFLKDPTGERRYLPIDCHPTAAKKKVFTDLPNEVDQIWAEAYNLYSNNLIGLTMPSYLENEVLAAQREHRLIDPLEDEIKAFINRPIPEDWYNWTLEERQRFWLNYKCEKEKVKLVCRNRVCAREILYEACEKDGKSATRSDILKISVIMAQMQEWESRKGIDFGKPYGITSGYQRKTYL